MLSFSQLSERKTKVKINPKKDEIIEGSGDVKKNHGEDCDCSKCDKKRRKDDVKDGPDVANEGYDKPDEKLKTDRNMFSIPKGEQDAAKERLKAKAAAKRKAKTQKEEAYVSQEEVSEESNQEIEAETEIPFLTFDQYQHAQTLDEEQLNEFLQGLFGGGKKPANANGAAKPSLSDRAVGALQNKGREGGLGLPVQRMLGRNDATAAAIEAMRGRSKGGKVKKEEVEMSEASLTRKPLNKATAVKKAESSSGKPNPLSTAMSSSQGSRSMAGRAGMAGSTQSAPKPSYMSKLIQNSPLASAIKKPINIKAPDGRAAKGLTVNPVKKESADIKSFRQFCQNPETVNELFGLFGGGSKKKEAPKTQSAPPPTPSAMSNMKPSIEVTASAMKNAGSNAPKGTSSGPSLSSGSSSKKKLEPELKSKKMSKSFKEAVQQFDERTRYAKETGKDFTTGNPSEKGGEGRSEVGKHMQKMMRPTGGAMSSRKKAIQPQGKKKKKGDKPKFKMEPTPVDKIKTKLSKKRAPKKDPYGYGQGRYQGD